MEVDLRGWLFSLSIFKKICLYLHLLYSFFNALIDGIQQMTFVDGGLFIGRESLLRIFNDKHIKFSHLPSRGLHKIWKCY
jgi:hypothetical protein